MQIQLTPAGEALKEIIAQDGDQAMALTNMLGGYNVDVLEAIANGDPLSGSAECFRAIADLVEKGFVTT